MRRGNTCYIAGNNERFGTGPRHVGRLPASAVAPLAHVLARIVRAVAIKCTMAIEQADMRFARGGRNKRQLRGRQHRRRGPYTIRRDVDAHCNTVGALSRKQARAEHDVATMIQFDAARSTDTVARSKPRFHALDRRAAAYNIIMPVKNKGFFRT